MLEQRAFDLTGEDQYPFSAAAEPNGTFEDTDVPRQVFQDFVRTIKGPRSQSSQAASGSGPVYNSQLQTAPSSSAIAGHADLTTGQSTTSRIERRHAEGHETNVETVPQDQWNTRKGKGPVQRG